MSADLLRRAAAKLRDTVDMTLPAPWTVIPLPGDRGYDVAAFPSQRVFVAQDLSESDAEWIALMDPAMAGPLAEWLDFAAEHWRIDAEIKHYPIRGILQRITADLARVILGEVPDVG
jgi:hypothetical protein